MALYKTTTADQNVDITQWDPIHYSDLPTQYPKSLYTFHGEIHVNAVSKVYFQKPQRKYSYGPFYDKDFSVSRLP